MMKVHDYVASYEFRGDGCDHTPTESEQTMIEDAIEGYLSTVGCTRLEALMEIRRIANEPGNRRALVDKIYGIATEACR